MRDPGRAHQGRAQEDPQGPVLQAARLTGCVSRAEPDIGVHTSCVAHAACARARHPFTMAPVYMRAPARVISDYLRAVPTELHQNLRCSPSHICALRSFGCGRAVVQVAETYTDFAQVMAIIARAHAGSAASYQQPNHGHMCAWRG